MDVKIARTLKIADLCAVALATGATALTQATAETDLALAWTAPSVTVIFGGVWCGAVFFARAASVSTLAAGSTGALRATITTFACFALLALISVVIGADLARTPLMIGMPVGLGLMLLTRLLLRGRIRRRPSSLQRARALLDDVARAPISSEAPAEAHVRRHPQ